MSIAAHVARFSPQFSLALEDAPPSRPPTPLADQPPSHAELAVAAHANDFVRAFIAEQLPTWTVERVERNPPCCLVYEHGEVVGNVNDIPAMIRHATKRQGLGSQLGLRALHPHEEVLAYTIGLRWSPTHPRRKRWEQRMALSRLLSRRDRRAVSQAMHQTKQAFFTWARQQEGLAARVRDCTSLRMDEFWRAVRGKEPSTRATNL